MMLFLSKSGSCHIRYFSSLHTLPRLAHRETMFVISERQWYDKICNTPDYISTLSLLFYSSDSHILSP